MELIIPYGMGATVAVSEIRKLNTQIPIFVASGYSYDPVRTNTADTDLPQAYASLRESLSCAW